MKKSLMYSVVQHLVLNDQMQLSNEMKLEILRELMAQEDLARFSEEQTEKANEAVTGG